MVHRDPGLEQNRKSPEFLALSRWGRFRFCSTAVVPISSRPPSSSIWPKTLGRFQGADSAALQVVREWLYRNVNVLFPPSFNCYGVQLGQQGLLPIHVEPTIASYHREHAETALSVLDKQLSNSSYLCADEPTIADLFCYGDVAFAELCSFDLQGWKNMTGWIERVTALAAFKSPFALLAMENAEL
jgi:glutathione S-transferase